MIGLVCLAVLVVGMSQNPLAQEEVPTQATETEELSETEVPEETETSATEPPDANEPEPPSNDQPIAPALVVNIPKITPPEQGYNFPVAVQALSYNTYSQLAATQGDANFCFSPQLLAKQLTALRFGAVGQTAAEVGVVFPFKMPVPQTAEFLRQVDASSAKIREGVQAPPTGAISQPLPPTFGQTNAIWVPRDHPIIEQYITGLKTGLATELYAADFKSKRDNSATTVNAWVRDTTGGRLASIIAEPYEISLPDNISIITTGVACASPRLATTFNRQLSGTNKFQLASGETIDVPMMRQIGSCMGLGMPNLQILVMPCIEDNLWFVVLLPATGQLGTLERSMTPTTLTQWFSQIQPMVVDVILPKVQLTSGLDLTDTLDNLGMQTIVSENAELTNMSQAVEKGTLKMSKFLHATQVSFVEQTDIPQQQVPQNPVKFYVDRPFVFLVWNIQTGTPLVVGRITYPQQAN